MAPPLPSPQKCSGASSAISCPCSLSPSQVCEGSVVHGGGQDMGRGVMPLSQKAAFASMPSFARSLRCP
eukprot:2035259-Pyramimonas_sp.AAC.1